MPRAVARVAADGTIDTSTTFASTIFSKDNVRSAASADGTTFFVTGSSGGMYTIALGAVGGGTSITATPSNMRYDEILDGQLFSSSGTTGSTSVQTIGNGVTTGAGQTATNLAGVTTANPYGFALFDTSTTVAGIDTLYIADATSGLERWTTDGTTWIKDTTFAALSSGIFGLTGWPTTTGIVLVVTSASTISRVAIPNAKPDSATVTTIATAATNTAFRGVTISAR